MRNRNQGMGLLVLIGSLLIVGLLAWFMLRPKPAPEVPVGDPDDAEEEVQTVRQDRAGEAAKRRMCAHECTSDARACRATALSAEEKVRCAETMATCKAACGG